MIRRPHRGDTPAGHQRHGTGSAQSLVGSFRGNRPRDSRRSQAAEAWAYTTVQTLLNRLQTKGYVRSDRSGSAHVYRPAVSRDQLLQLRLNDLSRKLCEGTASPLVMALVEGVRFTPEEIDQLRKLLDQLEEPKDGPDSKK